MDIHIGRCIIWSCFVIWHAGNNGYFFSVLPIDFTGGDLGTVGSLIIVSFSVFPAIAVAYQAGVVKGGIVLV